jgi:hypothetical protein
MKRLNPIRADGSKRYRPDVVIHPKQRSRRANGRPVLKRNSARGRRLAELLEIYGRALNLEDETVRGLVVSTARIATEVEDLEGRADLSPIDRLALTRMIGLRERNLEKLEAMRTGARARSEAPIAQGLGGWTQPLWRHLHFMLWVRDRTGGGGDYLERARKHPSVVTEYERRFKKAVNDPAVLAEYEALERQGEFASAVR